MVAAAATATGEGGHNGDAGGVGGCDKGGQRGTGTPQKGKWEWHFDHGRTVFITKTMSRTLPYGRSWVVFYSDLLGWEVLGGGGEHSVKVCVLLRVGSERGRNVVVQ